MGPGILRLRAEGRGFSLVEVLLALALLFVGVVAAAPMFIFAMKETAAGADLGSVGAAAVDRMELLRASDFYSLPAGGSLASNVSGYSDTSSSKVTVRWQIVDNASPPTVKTISVRAIAARQAIGLPKEVILTSLRAR
jgi:prepilin-type N-terminal cleavage/methylation domain-containing protein